MAENQFQKLTSEPAVFLLLLISLLLLQFILPRDVASQIANIYGLMFIGDYVLWSLGSDIKPQSGNSAKSLLHAGIAFAVLFMLYGFVQTSVQSVLPTANEQVSLLQTIKQSIITFNAEEIDIRQYKFGQFFLYAIFIGFLETRFIGRLYGNSAKIFNINISDLKSAKNWALVLIVSLIFMYFHLKVRGYNNNIGLAMTLLFMIVSLILIGRAKEMESANYLHIFWNGVAVAYG